MTNAAATTETVKLPAKLGKLFIMTRTLEAQDAELAAERGLVAARWVYRATIIATGEPVPFRADGAPCLTGEIAYAGEKKYLINRMNRLAAGLSWYGATCAT